MARLSADLTPIAATILALIIAAGPVPAQQSSDTESRLLACGDIGNPRDRLACFDSVVESVRPMEGLVLDGAAPPHGAEVAAVGVAVSASGAVPVSSEPAPAAVSATASEPAPNPAPGPAPRAVPGPAAGAAVATTAPAAGAPPASPGTAAKAPEVDANEDTEPEATGSAVITSVRENLDGRFTVELDNGEVWRETEGSRVGMPKEGASIRISRGAFGSYRMKIDGIPREARVRQVN